MKLLNRFLKACYDLYLKPILINMKSNKISILVIAAIVMAGLILQSCGTDSDDPITLNIESMTVGGMDLNAATAPDNVPLDATIEVTFNSNINTATATAANIALVQEYDDTEMPIQISASGPTLTIQPEEDLGSGALYQLELRSGLLNEDDQPLANTSRTFKTEGTFSPPGMIAHWPLDGNAEDAVGNFDALEVVDVTFGEPRNPEAGQVAVFNGNTSIIEIPNASDLISTSDFTLSFWMRTDSEGHVNENGDPAGHFVLGIGAFFGIQFEVAANYESAKFAIQFETADGSTFAEDMWFPAEATDRNSGGWQGWDYARSLSAQEMTNLLKDTWLHVTLTYDGDERRARMYYNGDLMKSFDFDLWPEDSIQRTTTGLTFSGQTPEVYDDLALGFLQSRAGELWSNEPWGGYDFPTSNHFKGQLDDVKIYHQVLSDSEIRLMYESDN